MLHGRWPHSPEFGRRRIRIFRIAAKHAHHAIVYLPVQLRFSRIQQLVQSKIRPLGNCDGEGEDDDPDVEPEEPEDEGGVVDAGICEAIVALPTKLAEIAVLP